MVGALGSGAGFVSSMRNLVIFRDAHTSLAYEPKLQLYGLENKRKKAIG